MPVRFTHILPLVTGPVHTCTISIPFLEHTALAAISALGTNCTHCHLCPTRYSFTPESSEACGGKVPCLRTQQLNNVAILRGVKHDISLKNPAQSGIRKARQAVTLAKLHVLTIAPRPSPKTTRRKVKSNEKIIRASESWDNLNLHIFSGMRPSGSGFDNLIFYIFSGISLKRLRW